MLDWRRTADTPAELEARWVQITDYALWLKRTYPVADHVLKECWPNHADVRTDLAAIREMWREVMVMVGPGASNYYFGWRQTLENLLALWRTSFEGCDDQHCRRDGTAGDERHRTKLEERQRDRAK